MELILLTEAHDLMLGVLETRDAYYLCDLDGDKFSARLLYTKAEGYFDPEDWETPTSKPLRMKIESLDWRKEFEKAKKMVNEHPRGNSSSPRT